MQREAFSAKSSAYSAAPDFSQGFDCIPDPLVHSMLVMMLDQNSILYMLQSKKIPSQKREAQLLNPGSESFHSFPLPPPSSTLFDVPFFI